MREEELTFRRASFCAGGGCVEVALDSNMVFHIRDAKQPDGKSPVLSFDANEWAAFSAGMIAGEFSHEALMR